MEIAALESDGKQMELSGNGTKQTEIMQKIFPHFFMYGSINLDLLTSEIACLALLAHW